MLDLIVIGAGLALARAAAERRTEVVVLEARARIGGRVLSHRTEAGAYDLGPAWVWPAIQPRIARAVQAAGLVLTEQAEAGGFVFQDHTGRIQRLPHGFAQEPPSMRITGGIAALVEAVAAGLAPGVVRLDHAVRRIALTGTGVAVTAETRSGPVTLHAARAALALPPRLIGGIEILPALPPSVQAALAAVPGWMAGQAKGSRSTTGRSGAMPACRAAHSARRDRSGNSTTRASPASPRLRCSAFSPGRPPCAPRDARPCRSWSPASSARCSAPRRGGRAR